MESLRTVAMGMLIVVLDVGQSGWDWVPDPLGWVLVLLGIGPLATTLRHRRPTLVLALVCLIVSVALWLPDAAQSVGPLLGWLLSLPTFAFCAVLCHALVGRTSGSLATRFRLLRASYGVLAVLPPLVTALDQAALEIGVAAAAVLTNVVLVFTLWAASDQGRP